MWLCWQCVFMNMSSLILLAYWDLTTTIEHLAPKFVLIQSEKRIHEDKACWASHLLILGVGKIKHLLIIKMQISISVTKAYVKISQKNMLASDCIMLQQVV